MPDSAQTLLERFQLVRVPSLPHLFLQPDFPPAGGERSARDLATGLADDPFLCLRLLGTSTEAEVMAEGGIEDLARRLPAGRLESLVASAALHTGFADAADLPLNFYKGHWRQAMLCSSLMRELARQCRYPREKQAALCGMLLDCGEVVLENVFAGQYLDLHRQAAGERELLGLERENFGSDHAELGAGLLAGWKLDRNLAEALRYHHEPAEAMHDAGKLARLAWLASAIAAGDTPREPLEAHARRLLQLEPAALEAAIGRAHAALEDKERSLRIRTGGRRLPLRESRSDEVAALDEVARLRLRQRLMGESLFNAVRPGAGRRERLSEALGSYLSLLFGLKSFALFRYDAAARRLEVVAGQPHFRDLAELEIQCGGRGEGGRQSVVLAAFSECERRRLEPGAEEASRFSVLDRQLLSLLGAKGLLCDPLPRDGRPAAVLVIGYNSSEIDYYVDQSLTVPLFKQALAGLLSAEDGAGEVSAELLHQQKVREVIHEVNNPLGIIKNYLQLLSMQQQDSPQVVEEIGVLKAEIDRISAILLKLRTEGGTEEFARTDLNAVIEKLARVFNSSVLKERQLQLVLDLDPDLPPLRSNENVLKQVITNLAVNAAEALTPQGTITVSTRAGVFSEGERFVEMMVSDNGPGIAPEVMERMFMRANTTKGPAHSGDGLAIVKTLCDGLGGRLSCRSGRQGTVFSLLLPYAPGEKA